MPEKNRETQNMLIHIGLERDLKMHQLTPHKIDAVTAALTTYLYPKEKTEKIGKQDSHIVVSTTIHRRKLRP